MTSRTVLHADMDAFYASIEQRDHPELRGLPVIVGGQQARGVVAAASYEARQFGVRSAMPGFEARQLCPDGVFLPPSMERYAAASAEVHRVFEQFTPEIEPLALDEAFLDITGSLRLFGGDAQRLGRELKARVRDATELCVSVGIASNKLVAKIACRLGKPDGLRVVPAGAERATLAPLPIRFLWGVGPVLGDKLSALGMQRIADLADASLERIAQAAGDRAAHLIALARGQDARPVEADRAPKSIGEESTFEHDVSDRDTIAQAIVAHSEEVARRLRGAGYSCQCITLKMKLGKARTPRTGSGRARGLREPDYPLLTRQRTLASASSDGQLIARTALALWDEAALGEAVRLLGVSASTLAPQAQEQLELFAPRRPQVGPTLDAIRNRFGADVIGRAVSAPEKVTPSLRKKTGD
ncbi:MAG TPA: DNA polymerase IV [Polyangiaceae bacterium]|nr:DNA polymerase IV [Polyangiaceae bacterium]